MAINQLIINQFRNIQIATLEPGPGINVLYGQNGSGKTSFLEAIYFLGLNRSFRSNLLQHVIQQNCDHFSIFAILNQHSVGEARLGVERARQGEKKLRLNGETINSLASIAKQMPLQLLTTESHRYFHDGPKLRRQFIDWGVFHVEPLFYNYWRLFNKALKQRNAGLKSNLPVGEIQVWDQEIYKLADSLDKYRKNYLDSLQPLIVELLQALELPALQLRYHRGWSVDKQLIEVLNKDLARDRLLGYTQHGPQRADLSVYADKTPAGDFLSQGQQKLAAYALYLAQGILLQRLGKLPIYLIDDLPSELDPNKRMLMSKVLAQLNSQIFITGVTLAELSDTIQLEQAKLFHVEHGGIVRSK